MCQFEMLNGNSVFPLRSLIEIAFPPYPQVLYEVLSFILLILQALTLISERNPSLTTCSIT